MSRSAWRIPIDSATRPSSGGAASEATDENAEITETRAAARIGSSDAAAMPIGKANAAPKPHAITPTPATGRFGAKPNSSRPARATRPETRRTATRPQRSMSRVPSSRTRVIDPMKIASTTAPTASARPNPSTTASESQLLADPSESAAAMMTVPIRRVRGSRHASSAVASPRRRTAVPGTARCDAARSDAATAVRCAGATVSRMTWEMEPRRQASATTAVTPNWTVRGTPACDARPPSPEPTTAPIESAAWKCGSIVRPMRRSTAAVSTLSGTLHSANDMPLSSTPTTSIATEPTVGPIPMNTYASVKPTVETSRMRRPPNRVTRAPAIITMANDPAEPASSTVPSCPVDSPSSSRTVGRRASQLENVSPLRANRPRSSRRARATRGSGTEGAMLATRRGALGARAVLP